MQQDRTGRDEFPFPDEEIERGGHRSWEELEEAGAHPGDPGIYPPLEEDEDAAGEPELP